MRKTKIVLNRLGIVLAEIDMSQKELATGTGLTESTISRYSTNERQPSLENLNLMADYMKIDSRRLLAPNKYATTDAQK